MNTNNTTNSRASDALSMHEENEDNVLNKELHQAMDKFYKLKKPIYPKLMSMMIIGALVLAPILMTLFL